MTLKRRIFGALIAFAIVGTIASQLPVSGVTAMAADPMCTLNGATYGVSLSLNGPQVTSIFVPLNGSVNVYSNLNTGGTASNPPATFSLGFNENLKITTTTAGMITISNNGEANSAVLHVESNGYIVDIPVTSQ